MIEITYMAKATHHLVDLDLSSIMDRLADDMEMDSATLTQAEQLYRQYLTLRAMHPGADLVPPKLADAVWHYHMLDSRKYAADCDAMLGGFLHHNPNTPAAVASKNWETTKKLYADTFGVDLDSLGLQAARCE